MNSPLPMSIESTTLNLVPGKMSTSASVASPWKIEYDWMSTPESSSTLKTVRVPDAGKLRVGKRAELLGR